VIRFLNLHSFIYLVGISRERKLVVGSFSHFSSLNKVSCWSVVQAVVYRQVGPVKAFLLLARGSVAEYSGAGDTARGIMGDTPRGVLAEGSGVPGMGGNSSRMMPRVVVTGGMGEATLRDLRLMKVSSRNRMSSIGSLRLA